MIQEEHSVIKVLAYYRDPGVIERINSQFRKLWIDVIWFYAISREKDLYEFYIAIPKNHKNKEILLRNLSKTVDVEYVELIEKYKVYIFFYGKLRDKNARSPLIIELSNNNFTEEQVGGVIEGEKFFSNIHKIKDLFQEVTFFPLIIPEEKIRMSWGEVIG